MDAEDAIIEFLSLIFIVLVGLLIYLFIKLLWIASDTNMSLSSVLPSNSSKLFQPKKMNPEIHEGDALGVTIASSGNNSSTRTSTQNINVDEEDEDGNTALFKAAATGKVEIVNMLLSAGADVNHENVEGQTALLCALKRKNVAVANVLLQAGANTHQTDERGCTPLMLAVVTGNVDLVKFILCPAPPPPASCSAVDATGDTGTASSDDTKVTASDVTMNAPDAAPDAALASTAAADTVVTARSTSPSELGWSLLGSSMFKTTAAAAPAV